MVAASFAAILTACELFVSTDGLSGGAGGPASPSLFDGGVQGQDGGGSSSGSSEAGRPPEALSAYSAAVLLDLPSLYWRLDETGGLPARDSSGHGADGVFSKAPTYAVPGAIAGDPDTAVTLGPAYVTAGRILGFEGQAAFSFEAWIKPIEDGDYHAILSRDDRGPGAGAPPAEGYVLVLNPGSPPTLLFSRMHAGGYSNVSSTALVPGQFNYVIVTYDGTTLALDLNGAEVQTSSSKLSIGTVVSGFAVGGDTGGPFSPFNGTVDEVAVYDHALSHDRILAHYHLGSGR
jgi:hypothetical protein